MLSKSLKRKWIASVARTHMLWKQIRELSEPIWSEQAKIRLNLNPIRWLLIFRVLRNDNDF